VKGYQVYEDGDDDNGDNKERGETAALKDKINSNTI
jgi:hypothetical protein